MEEVQSEQEKTMETEEKRNVAHQLAESFPKFVVNALIAFGIVLFYLFVIPLFLVLDTFALFVIEGPQPIILTGYSLLRVGVLLVALVFGVQAVIQFAKFADALVDYIVSRLPGMRSTDRGRLRRIPLDLIYILFILVIYVLVAPLLSSAVFPIPVLYPVFQGVVVAVVLYFVLSFMYDIAKTIHRAAKRSIDRFSKRIAKRFEDEEPEPIPESEY